MLWFASWARKRRRPANGLCAGFSHPCKHRHRRGPERSPMASTFESQTRKCSIARRRQFVEHFQAQARRDGCCGLRCVHHMPRSSRNFYGSAREDGRERLLAQSRVDRVLRELLDPCRNVREATSASQKPRQHYPRWPVSSARFLMCVRGCGRRFDMYFGRPYGFWPQAQRSRSARWQDPTRCRERTSMHNFHGTHGTTLCRRSMQLGYRASMWSVRVS